MPAFFVLFLLAVAAQAIITDPSSAFMGWLLFLGGAPLCWVLRGEEVRSIGQLYVKGQSGHSKGKERYPRRLTGKGMNLKHTASRADGVIPVKYRELMSVAVALTTQCAYCIESHIQNAVRAGATREEIAETVFIVAALRAGGAVGNGLCGFSMR